MMRSDIIFVLLFCVYYSNGEDICERPFELKAKEEYCWTNEVEIVDRVKTTSRNILNFAKKKLGIGEVEDAEEPKKCEYYQCIFNQLHLMNGNGYPVFDNIKSWAENHAIYRSALELFKRLTKCNEALANSAYRNEYFDADFVDVEVQPTLPPASEQSKCGLALEFMKCLAKQEGECPVFEFP